MYKQIIIARKDLDMSPGKLAAQVSHASMAFLTSMIRGKAKLHGKSDRYRILDKSGRFITKPIIYVGKSDEKNPYGEYELCNECESDFYYSSELKFDVGLYEEWINESFTKCILKAKNKKQLLKAKTIAEELGMKEGEDFFLIRDECRTELKSEDEDGRTLTCIGFKPMDSEIIDKIGKKYHLYM